MKKVILSLAVVALMLSACTENDCNCPVQTPNDQLSGDISGDVSLDASIEYKLIGTLRVKDGGSLTIPAGTVIKAEAGFSKFIIVERGGQVFANGTADAPITLTSAAASPAAGDWGGLIINGKAPISGAEAGTEAATEVDPTSLYGGTDASDNSGELSYVIIAYTGAKSSSNVEHNGLTLNAVGSGTVIENIYVPYSADDGIEFFGGSVSVTNLLVVNSDDDMFDLTQGWNGTLSNAYGVWEAGYTSGEGDPRGIESDGNWDGLGPDHIGQSDYTMENISIVNNSDFEMHDAIKIRRGATATITNVLVTGIVKDVVDLTDSKGDANVATDVSYKIDGTVSGKEVNPETGYAGVVSNSANTGANVSVFDWTDYTF